MGKTHEDYIYEYYGVEGALRNIQEASLNLSLATKRLRNRMDGQNIDGVYNDFVDGYAELKFWIKMSKLLTHRQIESISLYMEERAEQKAQEIRGEVSGA